LDCESSNNLPDDYDRLEEYMSNANLMNDFDLNKKSKKMTDAQFQQQVLSRFEYYEEKRIEKMMKVKEERYLEENKELTLIPNLHNDNHNFVSQNHENLVERLDKIIEKKKTALEKERYSRHVAQEKEELKECSFTPTINKE
jgi:hypothetical protein